MKTALFGVVPNAATASVQPGILRLVGDEPIIRAHFPEDQFPQLLHIGEVDNLPLRLMRNPGIPFHFILQLAPRPTGIAHKGADVKSFHLIHDCLGGGKMRRKLERFIFLRPAQRGKSKVLGADRTAHEDGNIDEPVTLFRRKNFFTQKIAHISPDRPVQDVPECPVFPGMLGEKKHALKKSRLLQTRISEDQASLEGIVGWIFRGHEKEMRPAPP